MNADRTASTSTRSCAEVRRGRRAVLGPGRRAHRRADATRVARTCELRSAATIRGGRAAPTCGTGSGRTRSYLDVVGAHRWPLFTSLDMTKYRDWLAPAAHAHRASRAAFWTWVQNHLPDWYIANVLGQKPTDPFTDPIGPHPEQVRLMAYIAIACGCRGLGFWSDRFLADSHHGRDRLQGMALLERRNRHAQPGAAGAAHATGRSGSTRTTRT